MVGNNFLSSRTAPLPKEFFARSIPDNYYIKEAIFPKLLLFCFCPTFFQPVLLDSYFFAIPTFLLFFQKSTGHPDVLARTKSLDIRTVRLVVV